MQRKVISHVLSGLFGGASGFLLFRLALGMPYQSPGVYTQFVWYVLYPVQLLRSMSDQSIYILFYVLLWSYVLIIKVIVYEAPLGRTLVKMLFWMGVIALPFVPFGIEYLSLTRYSTTIDSYLVRLLPFAGLLVLLFLGNHIYFKQNYRVAGAWSFVNFVLIIVVITLADLLPMLKSRIFLHALEYRASLLNTFLSTMPVLSLLLVIGLSLFYIIVFEQQFLQARGNGNQILRVLTPVGVAIALFLALLILRDDFRRYRYFDYQGGIATVYFAAYDDRQSVSFDNKEFRISGGRQSVFYPFGKFNGRDVLRRHADDILRMKLIEGLDYYRLTRIVKIIAHGPRDTLIYKRLQPVISGRRYRKPAELDFWADYLHRRYAMPSNDMVVTGWIKVNGVFLSLTEFFVNKISLSDTRVVEPVWQDRTDIDGRFQFSCYKDVESDNGYFQVSFLLPHAIIGNDVRSLNITHPLPVFFRPGEYVLDTVSITVIRGGGESYSKTLSVQTSSEPDSLMLFLPEVGSVVPLQLAGSVTASGELADMVVEFATVEADTSTRNAIVRRIGNSRFYLAQPEGNVVIKIY
jgi:hypothetical protein